MGIQQNGALGAFNVHIVTDKNGHINLHYFFKHPNDADKAKSSAMFPWRLSMRKHLSLDCPSVFWWACAAIDFDKNGFLA
jgi:hypothetical protein